MNTMHDKLDDKTYSATNAYQPASFICHARGAKSVHLAGDFNNWRPCLMEQSHDGWWLAQVWLPQGRHQYRFLVDGEPALDLNAAGVARDELGRPVSLITVG